MGPNARRVATRRLLAELRTPAWDGRPVSWAWVAPSSVVHVLEDADDGPGDGGDTGHDRWARAFLAQRGEAVGPGESPSDRLLDEGWVRMVTPFDFETATGRFTKEWSRKAVLQVLVDTVHRAKLNPETRRVVQSWRGGHRTMSVADFVKREGGREWERKLFEGLL